MEKILYDYYNNFAVQLYKGNVKSAEQYQNMEKDLENMNTDKNDVALKYLSNKIFKK